MDIRVRFLGAAEGVTGSRHLLEVDDTRILIDCGLCQGRRQWARDHNVNLAVDPATIHNVVLTHAHIDHSGALPILCRDGFRGEIFATAATADLAPIMLRDSGYIQEKDAEYLNKRARREARREGRPSGPPVEPIYTVADAEACDSFFHPIPYEFEAEIGPGISLRFTDQGHIIGSAAAHITIERGLESCRILFSGDRGRPNMPILRNPTPYPECDVVFTESTYGNRVHEPPSDMETRLAELVHDAVRRRSKLLIPAFAVGRTQNILYFLHKLRLNGTIPYVEVYVDSPLAHRATRVYAEHPECFDEATLDFLRAQTNPFRFEGLRFVQSVEESKALNEHPGPCVIFSASGMCESGRVLHHLKHTVEEERHTILIVGWMAPHTLGRRLVEGARRVKIFRDEYDVRSRVVKLNGFSAHADREDLVASLAHLKGRAVPVYLIHGERKQSEPLRERLLEEGHPDVRIAELFSEARLW